MECLSPGPRALQNDKKQALRVLIRLADIFEGMSPPASVPETRMHVPGSPNIQKQAIKYIQEYTTELNSSIWELRHELSIPNTIAIFWPT
eukprot:3031556-Amphidinium_carterae.1